MVISWQQCECLEDLQPVALAQCPPQPLGGEHVRHSVTVSQCQCHSITVLQCYSVTVLQCYSVTAFRV